MEEVTVMMASSYNSSGEAETINQKHYVTKSAGTHHTTQVNSVHENRVVTHKL